MHQVKILRGTLRVFVSFGLVSSLANQARHQVHTQMLILSASWKWQ